MGNVIIIPPRGISLAFTLAVLNAPATNGGSAGGFQSVAYARSRDVVFVRGRVQSLPAAPFDMFTLPAGMVPLEDEVFSCPQSGTSAANPVLVRVCGVASPVSVPGAVRLMTSSLGSAVVMNFSFSVA